MKITSCIHYFDISTFCSIFPLCFSWKTKFFFGKIANNFSFINFIILPFNIFECIYTFSFAKYLFCKFITKPRCFIPIYALYGTLCLNLSISNFFRCLITLKIARIYTNYFFFLILFFSQLLLKPF